MYFTKDPNWAKIFLEVGSKPPKYEYSFHPRKPRGHAGEKYRLIWRGKIIKPNQHSAIMTLETINSKLNYGTEKPKNLPKLLEGRNIFEKNEFFIE